MYEYCMIVVKEPQQTPENFLQNSSCTAVKVLISVELTLEDVFVCVLKHLCYDHTPLCSLSTQTMQTVTG